MHGRDLPEPSRQLIDRHIDSVGRLDLLLVLYQDPAAAWTPERMAKQMRTTVRWTAGQLQALEQAGVTRRASGEEGWCYAPADEETLAAVDALVAACRVDWSGVTRLIMDRRPSGAQAFSDAFRLRKRPGG